MSTAWCSRTNGFSHGARQPWRPTRNDRPCTRCGRTHPPQVASSQQRLATPQHKQGSREPPDHSSQANQNNDADWRGAKRPGHYGLGGPSQGRSLAGPSRIRLVVPQDLTATSGARLTTPIPGRLQPMYGTIRRASFILLSLHRGPQQQTLRTCGTVSRADRIPVRPRLLPRVR